MMYVGCGRRPMKPGLKRCEPCLRYQRIMSKNYREAQKRGIYRKPGRPLNKVDHITPPLPLDGCYSVPGSKKEGISQSAGTASIPGRSLGFPGNNNFVFDRKIPYCYQHAGFVILRYNKKRR